RLLVSLSPGLLVCLLLAALGLSLALLLQDTPPPQQAPSPPAAQPLRDVFYQDFRGRGPLSPALELFNADDSVCGRETEGLRITIPVTQKHHNVAGVILALRLKCDFEITTGYEILKAEFPTAGHGVGFELYLTTDTPRRSGIGFSRLARTNEGDVYWSARMTTDEDNKEHYEQNNCPAAAPSGPLRLIRTGEGVPFRAAEGAGEFKRLFTHHVGSEDLKTVRVAASPGWAANLVDLRVKDLRVRALSAQEARVAALEPGVFQQDRPK